MLYPNSNKTRPTIKVIMALNRIKINNFLEIISSSDKFLHFSKFLLHIKKDIMFALNFDTYKYIDQVSKMNIILINKFNVKKNKKKF